MLDVEVAGADSPEAKEEKLRAFTDGEIRVLGALVSGGALTAVARQLRIGHETVRSHLKSIFAKTGTHRQGELIALVLALSSLPWPRR